MLTCQQRQNNIQHNERAIQKVFKIRNYGGFVYGGAVNSFQWKRIEEFQSMNTFVVEGKTNRPVLCNLW